MLTEQGPKYEALVKKLRPFNGLRSIRGQRFRDLKTAAALGTFPPRLPNSCPAAAPSPVAAPAHVASPIPTKSW